MKRTFIFASEYLLFCCFFSQFSSSNSESELSLISLAGNDFVNRLLVSFFMSDTVLPEAEDLSVPLTADSVLTSSGSPGMASIRLSEVWFLSGCREIFWALLFLRFFGELPSKAVLMTPE